VVAAVAVGALAAAGYGQTASSGTSSPDITPLANNGSDAAFNIGGDAPAGPEVLAIAKITDPLAEAQKLVASQKLLADTARKAVQAALPDFIKPAVGAFTSGFGGRWGAFHYGVDIANVKDTPIVACADGVIIDAGPASGFGLWVREQLSDGTILVYGHMDDFSVHTGQHVKAGQQIARMGNRGFSTGYHLHFEVWRPDGKKIDPLPWLNARGIIL
jgi:murein DD-endopeptidase MepM/ murein hydrolase activator NlpD